MKKFSLTLGLALLTLPFFAQNQFKTQNINQVQLKECGSDEIHQELMQNDPVYRQKQEAYEMLLKDPSYAATLKSGTIYKVPVVVHVMNPGDALGTGANLSDAQVKAGIDYVNQRFRKITGGLGDGNGVDIGIEFALAVRDENNQCTDGIVRVDMSGNATYVSGGVKRNTSNGISDATLKSTSRWDATKYYNIYVVNRIDGENCSVNDGGYIAGYANFASSHGGATDASVMLACTYNSETSTTFTHELGHAFNLYHTFQGDNSGASCPSGSGDFCDDTPLHIRFSSHSGYSSNYGNCAYAGSNSCDAGTTQDHMLNYMDYSYDVCQDEFTADQKTRMVAAMTTQRSSYLESNGNQSLLPVSTAIVDFKATGTAVCTGSAVTFTDESSCSPNTYINSGWPTITYSWSFDDGVNPPITSTDQNPTITFNIAGSYDVTLAVTNSHGTTNKTVQDYLVVTGGAIAGCSVSSSNNNNNFGCGVTNVSFNTIDNGTSTFIPSNAHNDFICSSSTVIEEGNSYQLDVNYDARSDGSQHLEVWIDYDNSGTFESSNSFGDNEMVLSDNIAASASGSPSTNVTPPANAVKDQLLRMRVISNYNSAPNECGNGLVQRADDYGVYIQAASNCTDPDVPTISGTTTICNGGNTTLSINTGNLNDASNWQWYTTSCGGTSAGSGTSINVSPTTTTTYYVRGEGGCVTPGSCANVEVTVNDVPGNVGAITGNTTFCENATNVAYSIAAVNGATNYAWTVPNGATIQSGQGTTSITVNFGTNSGNVGVTASNTCGNGGVNSKAVSVNDVPGNAGAITGNTTVCENATNVSYSIAAVNGATNYAWTVPNGASIQSGQGTTSITVNFGTNSGNVGVTPSNTCGNGGANSKAVTVEVCGGGAPVANFSGSPTTVCEGETVTFTDLSTNNPTSWSWSFPGGNPATSTAQNPTVTYSTAGSYQVQLTATNASGNDNETKANYVTVDAVNGTNIGLASLKPWDCGRVLNDPSTEIFSNTTTGATGYQFKVINTGLGFSYETPWWRKAKWLRLSDIPGIQPGVTYDVQVRGTDGKCDVGEYSEVCQVTSASQVVSSTKLISSQCGTTIGSSSAPVYANPISGATNYTFELSNTGLGYTETKTNGIRYFKLFQYAVQPNTTYNVRVRATVGGQTGNYGPSCQITTPSSLNMEELTARMIESGALSFEMNDEMLIDERAMESVIESTVDFVAYPNPNQGEYVFVELNKSVDMATVLVTDVYGKQIYTQNISANQTTIKFENKLSPGFYFVTLLIDGERMTKKLMVK